MKNYYKQKNYRSVVSRGNFLIASILLVMMFFSQNVTAQCFINLGLNSWSVEGDPANGNWIPAVDGNSVRQTINSNPSFYVSNAEYFNTTIQGEFRVETTSDDDFIGFVIGYQSPNSTTPNNNYNFIMFDWKQAPQASGGCTAPAAMRLTRFQGSSSDFAAAFWCQNSPINQVLATNASMGGWADNTLYTFQVQYGASNISVWVNGTQIFDVDGTYPSGRFGFYNYSQEAVLYQNFSLPFSAVINKTDVSCTGANDGTATAVVSDFATPPYDYLWSTGATTETITNLAPGSYTVTVTSQEGCVANQNVTIETTPDTESPTVSANTNLTVNLDSGGTGGISISDVEISSSDNCGIASKTLSQSTFDCSQIGNNTINFTVTDTSGNTTVTPINVNVLDVINPTVLTQNLSLQLTDPTGITITPAMVDNGSRDNCTFTLSLSKTAFDCSDIGTQSVVLTVTDSSGNISNANADITILAPEPYVVTSPGDTQMVNISTFTTVDASIALTYSGNANGALVSISNNFVAGDELALDAGYTLPGGVASSYNGSTGVLTVSGTLTDSDLETLFQNVQFRTTSSNTAQRTITFIIGSSVSNPDNSHYYEYVNQSLTWVQAKAAAATRTLYGLQGYLATSTSVEENNFIKNKLTDDGWLGGSDNFAQINLAAGTTVFANQSAAEGNWYWITGPEAGTQFSVGSTPSPGQYANWNASEPNNSGGSEDYLQVYFANNGRWNDLGNAQSMGYIVEYGGLAGDQTCFSFSNDKIILLNQAPVIDPISNQVACPGSPFNQNVLISDVEDAATDLTVTATSANQAVVQNANLSVSYNGTNFVVSGTPEMGVQGSTVITVTATDTGGLSTSADFTFTAQDNEAPIVVCQGGMPVYIGSYLVSDGPNWGSNPPVYNAQEAAALIFGGNAADYSISTNSNTTDPNTITHTAWTDSWGDSFAIYAEDYSYDAGAPGYNDPGGFGSAISAYVQDHVDNTKINYVWTSATPLILQLDANGQAILNAADVDGGSTDNCGIANISVSPENFTCANIGPNTVTLTVTDVNGNSASCISTIMIEDTVAPTAVCQNITVQLDANGNATITPADVDGGSSDVCGIASTTIDVSTFDCSNVGANNVILTVTDNNGNVSTCTAVVTVEDNVVPTAVCQNITIQLDANGNATITPADVDGGSTDACGIASTTIDVTSFDCSNVGVNNVMLTVTDNNGNVSTCTAVVTVEDNVAPTAVCQNITVQLDANGNATITPADVDGGSSDACGIASTTIDVSTFDCSNVGANNVILTVTDNNGNVSTCTAVVTVEDNVAPTAVCQNITIQLDANGNASITPADVDGGSADACGIASTNIDVSTFDCSNVGANNLILTVTDNNGNVSTCTAVVTVEDNVAPTAVCQNITVQLDANGNATITPADVDGGSTDACGIASTTIDVSTFDCSNVGANNVILTVTDNNGNVSTCTAVVTVEDTVAPIIVCPADLYSETHLGDCFAVVYFPQPLTLDNCGIDTVVQTAGLPSGSQFPVGISTIEFTATDVNGNVSTCSFAITVTDNESPMAVCQNITIQLDANGNATITPADVDGGSSDNCGLASTSIDVDTFDCSNVGDNVVILTVTDVNGNSSSCTAIVTVEDVIAPVVACQNITVQLDPVTGTITINGSDIDNGSTDACGIANYELDIDTFDCSNIGDNLVILTVADVNGNSESCAATVTVEDITAPALVCQDFTIELGIDGAATLLPTDVIASNEDACGILTTAVDITEFSCADIGTPVTVQVFSQDNNGNLATCTAVVTVVDNLAPVISCPMDQTVDPGAGNLFYILPDYFATGEATVADNCTDPVVLTSQDPVAGTPLPDGTYTITLTATDEYGNIGTCDFELTVDTVLGTGGDNQNLESVVIYPNPAKGILNISNPQGLDLERLEIYDLRGRLVQTADLRGMGSNKPINVHLLAAASYYVKLLGANGEITKRLLKE
ncbi:MULTISPECIES: HYR domain-containing protein [Aequorivita]|uniref:HYR domain-containing protein n=1 Tax=Aequorivita iocasae TaxID=2803865 RepID=A0ABX7DT19_9FLAO|nr:MULTISPECIES: HYR domain-containing protein [Aequorivita]QQX77300.1 HYR domain-containing protein [Aequorivita iocasae]UCA56789.1 HYR domain-containing protein [Aequorivita sp. F7]